MDILDLLKNSKGHSYTPKEISLMLREDSNKVSRQLSNLHRHGVVESAEVPVFGSKRKFYKFRI